MSEPLDDYLRDPVMLDELMLVTKVMIATKHDPQPMPQEKIDKLLGVDQGRPAGSRTSPQPIQHHGQRA